MIQDYFNTSFDIKRQQWSDNKSSYSKTGSFNGYMQKTDIGFSEQLGSDLTKTFTIWCPVDTDVEESDTLEDDNYTYSVRTIRNFDIGHNQHKRLIVERN